MFNPSKQAWPKPSVAFETPLTLNVAPPSGWGPVPRLTFLAVLVTWIAPAPLFVYVQVTRPSGATVMSAWALFVGSCVPLEPVPVVVQSRVSSVKIADSAPSVSV